MRPPEPLDIGLIVIIILIVIAAGITTWLLFTLIQQKKRKDDRSLDIAKERYTKGEISKDEFEKLKKDIT